MRLFQGERFVKEKKLLARMELRVSRLYLHVEITRLQLEKILY